VVLVNIENSSLTTHPPSARLWFASRHSYFAQPPSSAEEGRPRAPKRFVNLGQLCLS
jgi:hypothetical protein